MFSTWRSAWHALLKGIPEEWLFAEILAGRSLHICNRQYKFFSSSIVAGHLPIALGVALAIKRAGGSERVHVFLGDSAARCGLFWEFLSYCDGHKLPVRVIVEDNGMSVTTPTEIAWGGKVVWRATNIEVVHYEYVPTEAHCGVGTWVEF